MFVRDSASQEKSVKRMSVRSATPSAERISIASRTKEVILMRVGNRSVRLFASATREVRGCFSRHNRWLLTFRLENNVSALMDVLGERNAR